MCPRQPRTTADFESVGCWSLCLTVFRGSDRESVSAELYLVKVHRDYILCFLSVGVKSSDRLCPVNVHSDYILCFLSVSVKEF